MGIYALEVRYGEDEPPLRIRLPDCSADEAEARRQALVTEIDHAIELDAPVIPADAIDADLAHDVSIDPGRVTDVALVDAVD